MEGNAVKSAVGEVGQPADMKFCKNCKKDIAAGNFTVHEAHCVRNITLCPHCDSPIAKSDLECHIAEHHTKVACPHCPTLLLKSEVDQHIADAHATEPCPECGENISKNRLEDHKRVVHSTAACPLCQTVIEKTDLHRHQMTSCTKRQEPCQYCSMMLAYSELQGHEDYCGSRTEPCETCGRYIMVRDAEIHRESNCEYPAVDQKSDSESSTGARFDWIGGERDFPGALGNFFGAGMFRTDADLPDPIQEMLQNPHCDLPDLASLLRQMGYRRPSSGVTLPDDTFFGHRLRPFHNNSSPPPYIDHNNVDDRHASDSHVTPETLSTFPDHVSVSSDDDDDVTLPCEFCKKLYVAKKLLNHQASCRLSYVENADNNHGGDDELYLPELGDDFQSLEPQTSERATLERDTVRSSPVPVIVDDSHGLTDQDLVTDSVAAVAAADSDHRSVQVEDANDVITYDQSAIPCEFCLELFDEHTIAEHQDVCYRQQTSALEAILATGGSDTADVASRYRYPYSVMSLEDRERLGQ